VTEDNKLRGKLWQKIKRYPFHEKSSSFRLPSFLTFLALNSPLFYMSSILGPDFKLKLNLILQKVNKPSTPTQYL
jgi:hypothetical protein